MYITLQRSLLILFALLQCLSPLAHAHVNGVDAGHNVYSHDLDHYAAASDTQVENELGAVIAMSLAYPAGDGPVVTQGQSAPLGKIFAAASLRSALETDSRYLSPEQILSRHVLPWSQAPPV